MRALAGQASCCNQEILWGWNPSAGGKWGHLSLVTGQKMNLSHFPVIWIHRRLIFFTAVGPETDSYHTFIFFPIIFYTVFKYVDICTQRRVEHNWVLLFWVFKRYFEFIYSSWITNNIKMKFDFFSTNSIYSFCRFLFLYLIL